jgi:hypothetical protein
MPRERRRRANCWKCGRRMYRDEMVKIFGHGLQTGHKQQGALRYGANVVVCRDCVETVREKNREGNVLAVIAWIVIAIVVFGLGAIFQVN